MFTFYFPHMNHSTRSKPKATDVKISLLSRSFCIADALGGSTVRGVDIVNDILQVGKGGGRGRSRQVSTDG